MDELSLQDFTTKIHSAEVTEEELELLFYAYDMNSDGYMDLDN
jgi:Ca2+-binding EF-hand superfamily protein